MSDFVCASCDQEIWSDEEMLSVDGRTVHYDCFMDDIEVGV